MTEQFEHSSLHKIRIWGADAVAAVKVLVDLTQEVPIPADAEWSFTPLMTMYELWSPFSVAMGERRERPRWVDLVVTYEQLGVIVKWCEAKGYTCKGPTP